MVVIDREYALKTAGASEKGWYVIVQDQVLSSDLHDRIDIEWVRIAEPRNICGTKKPESGLDFLPSKEKYGIDQQISGFDLREISGSNPPPLWISKSNLLKTILDPNLTTKTVDLTP